MEFIEISINNIIDQVCKKKGNYNQAGKNNNNYKNGISTYTKRKKSKCQRCGGTRNLMVHHKDHNRKNNSASNLETLCWSCHEKKTVRKFDSEYKVDNIIFDPKPEGLNWGVGCIVINAVTGDILLGKRVDNKLWGSPGGGVEDTETPYDAIIREIKEESNLDIGLVYYVGTGYSYNENKIWTSYCFVCEYDGVDPIPQIDEVSEWKWVPIEDLNEYDIFNPTIESISIINQVYPEILTDSFYSENFNGLDVENFVLKMTSIEQLVGAKNPGKNGGNGVISSTGWTYKKPGQKRSYDDKLKGLKHRAPVESPTLTQIQQLKQSYIDYFSKVSGFKKLYKIQDGKFIFPNYKDASKDGIVKDKKSYQVLFKEQYIHYSLNKDK